MRELCFSVHNSVNNWFRTLHEHAILVLRNHFMHIPSILLLTSFRPVALLSPIEEEARTAALQARMIAQQVKQAICSPFIIYFHIKLLSYGGFCRPFIEAT